MDRGQSVEAELAEAWEAAKKSIADDLIIDAARSMASDEVRYSDELYRQYRDPAGSVSSE